MRRLSGEAAGFLSLELPIQPMNTLVLAVLRPATAPDGSPLPLDLAYVRRHMASRLGELPVFRWRVERVPFGLHHPVFIEDPTFDLDFHIGEHVLAAPGSAAELDRYCAGLAEQTLDRRHPLWQLVLVHGLQGERQAVVLRIHHCLMDGFATLATLACIFSPEGVSPEGVSPEGHDLAAIAPTRQPDRAPQRWRLLASGLRDQAASMPRLVALVRKTRRNQAAANAEHSAAIKVPKSGVDTPPSLINQAFSADRRFSRTSVPLADVKLVKDVAGLSVNDVALGLVAGSLRSYLQARSALPTKPLVATVPVAMEQPGAPPRTYGNRFSGLVTSLATDIDDPWERMRAIATVTAEAKRQLEVRGPELLPDWLEVLPPALLDRAVRHGHRKRCRDPDKVDVNIVVSNLRGPGPDCSLGSALVEEMYVAGPPNNGVGANVVLMDYGDHIFFSILCFADSVEAPEELAQGLHRALAELVQTATALAGRPASSATGPERG